MNQYPNKIPTNVNMAPGMSNPAMFGGPMGSISTNRTVIPGIETNSGI